MPRKRQKRRREGGAGDDDDGTGGGGGGGDVGGGRAGSTPPPPAASPALSLKRLCRPSFDTDIEGCSCSCSCRQHQELPTGSGCACVQALKRGLEAAVSRFMGEVTEVLAGPCCYLPPGPRERIEQSLPLTYKLSFLTSLSNEIFTTKEVRAADGGQIKIRMVASSEQGSNWPHLSSASVKIVVLDGDFNADNREGWTSQEFERHIVLPRDRVGVVLAGKLEFKLDNGEAYLHNVTFRDNSSFTRSRKFRLGVMLTDNLGERVQEGITEPFTVKDRRGEDYRKCDIPMLEHEVWRLENIARNGVFHKALEQSGITRVKHFLRLYYKALEQSGFLDIWLQRD